MRTWRSKSVRSVRSMLRRLVGEERGDGILVWVVSTALLLFLAVGALTYVSRPVNEMVQAIGCLVTADIPGARDHWGKAKDEASKPPQKSPQVEGCNQGGTSI